jgi:hypothetical protein
VKKTAAVVLVHHQGHVLNNKLFFFLKQAGQDWVVHEQHPV